MNSLTNEQELAVALCCDVTERIVGITGSAGTGKTFVLGHAYREMQRLYGSKTILCAPTGRAAKRIQELTGIRAMTIHRLLEFPAPDDPVDLTVKGRPEDEEVEIKNVPTDHEPKRNKSNPIDYKYVFVDESSMLGQTLYRQLLDAMPAAGCVRFFGDMNQLPPVEEGLPPFYDILDTKPSVRLTLNFRNDDEIVANARLILQGSIPRKNNRFHIVYSQQPVKDLIAWAKAETFTDDNNQIIMPTRKGKAGTGIVNTSLQLKFNPRGEFLRLDRFDKSEAPLLVRAGDKFLWIKNDYNLKMFNGEIGKIEWVNTEDGELGLVTPEQLVHVPARVKTFSPYLRHYINYDPRKQIELGYAITTHKSQGSEFDTVVYCMSSSSPYLLNRQNFYTAVTRAKKQVIVICDNKAMGRSMRKERR